MRISAVLLAGILAVGCAHRPWDSPADSWKVVRSDHFVVRTDAPPERYEPVIRHLEDVYEALSGTFFAGVPMPPVDVLLFGKQEDFEGVAPGHLLGFLTLRARSFEEGLLVLSADAEDPGAAESTAAHELAHRFLYALNEKVPRWLHEGFAEYVAALEIRDTQVAFDASTSVPSYVYFEDPVPLERLLTSGTSDFFGADARAVYMTAWMLVRQLLGNPRPGMVDKLQLLIARSSMASTPSAQAAALRDAFEGAPMPEIESGLQDTYRSILRGDRPPPARRTLAFTLKREHRRPWTVYLADQDAIKDVCADLRAQRAP
jgi:hypothetical protein